MSGRLYEAVKIELIRQYLADEITLKQYLDGRHGLQETEVELFLSDEPFCEIEVPTGLTDQQST